MWEDVILDVNRGALYCIICVYIRILLEKSGVLCCQFRYGDLYMYSSR
jgi:hypothetical protein